MPVTLDVWSDLVCPWCYIGKRRLAAALAQEAPGSVHVRWHAFQLQPDLPTEGVDAKRYFAAKFGGAERVRAIHDRVSAVARDVGLELHFDRQEHAPNTRLAHRAVKLADDEEAAIETLFAAHFADGEDIGDPETVLRLLPDVDPGALQRGDGDGAVDDDLDVAAQIGVTGVPFFVAAGRVAISGAHEPEMLRKVIEAGREQQAAA
ncbi:MAG: DsbA family oxidoreductase [Solirubrobacteraceae bacterium]